MLRTAVNAEHQWTAESPHKDYDQCVEHVPLGWLQTLADEYSSTLDHTQTLDTHKKHMVFHKKTTPFSVFHNSIKWWSIYMKFLSVVAEEILTQNILTNVETD